MAKYTLFESKLFLMVYLIKNHKLAIDDLVTLKPNQAIEILAQSKDKEVANNLKTYLNKKLPRIKAANLFFPGQKEGSKSSAGSIHIEIYKYLKVQGLTMKDIGLKLSDGYRIKKRKTIDAIDTEDIFASAKELLK